MQTRLTEQIKGTPEGREADRILRTCVHCGFCNATCPTYQLLGDELDGPRGRIYLIKQLLEGEETGAHTQLHLDRCLTCRSCETTCPSGVEYARLLDIGREHLESRVKRPRTERLFRRLLRAVLPYPERVTRALALARRFRFVLPRHLAEAVPRQSAPNEKADPWPPARHGRRMLMLDGCVQPATRPQINTAAARLLDRHGISLVRASSAGCCGALSHHLAASDEAREFMVRNLNAWRPYIDEGVEAIVSTSSACSAMLNDYARLLGDDPAHGETARRVAALAKDITDVVADLDLAPPDGGARPQRIAFHAPCSLQHGLRRHNAAENALRGIGFELAPVREAHLCCGAAGTYSMLQPELSHRLRDDKLQSLQAGGPAAIATANIGCLIHLQCATDTPVRHWVELVEEADKAGCEGSDVKAQPESGLSHS